MTYSPPRNTKYVRCCRVPCIHICHSHPLSETRHSSYVHSQRLDNNVYQVISSPISRDRSLAVRLRLMFRGPLPKVVTDSNPRTAAQDAPAAVTVFNDAGRSQAAPESIAIVPAKTAVLNLILLSKSRSVCSRSSIDSRSVVLFKSFSIHIPLG
jgi:hypothetical protein